MCKSLVLDINSSVCAVLVMHKILKPLRVCSECACVMCASIYIG